MLRFMCLSLFAVASAFPFGKMFRERNQSGSYNVQLIEYEAFPRQKNSICLPAPFLRQICLPTAIQFLMPLQTLRTEEQRCLMVPIMKTYVMKVCPPRKFNPQVENSDKTSKANFKEIETEEETERLPDKTDSEVNGKEAEREFLITEETNEKTKESEVKDKSSETTTDIIRIFPETELSEENGFHREHLFDDENVSITSNLV